MVKDDLLSLLKYIIKQEVPTIDSKKLDDITVSLQKMAGGDRFYIYKYNNRNLEKRNEEIRSKYQAGLSKEFLQKKYSLSRTSIRRIINGH